MYYSCNAKVHGLGEIFLLRDISAIRYFVPEVILSVELYLCVHLQQYQLLHHEFWSPGLFLIGHHFHSENVQLCLTDDLHY